MTDLPYPPDALGVNQVIKTHDEWWIFYEERMGDDEEIWRTWADGPYDEVQVDSQANMLRGMDVTRPGLFRNFQIRKAIVTVEWPDA